MVNTLLIIWSVLAAVIVFVIGMVLVFSPCGETGPGILLMVIAAMIGVACAQLCREQWGLGRRKRAYRSISARSSVTHKRRRAAPVTPARRQQRAKTTKPNRSGRRGGSVAGQHRRVLDAQESHENGLNG